MFGLALGKWKGAVLYGAAMVFGVAVLTVSVLATTDPVRVGEAAAGSLGTGSGVQVEYYLPYPGVLPDSKLYFLKMVRDRVRLWATTGEEKKAQRELEYADKRLGAAVALVEGGKVELGVKTFTKAEKYLERAVNRTIEMSAGGKDVKSLLLRLDKASMKHAQVGAGIAARADEEQGGVAGQMVNVTLVLRERVGQALLEAK